MIITGSLCFTAKYPPEEPNKPHCIQTQHPPKPNPTPSPLPSSRPPQHQPHTPTPHRPPSTRRFHSHLARARRPRSVVPAPLPLARLDYHAPPALPLVLEVAALALRIDVSLDHVGHGRTAAPVARVELKVAPVGDEAPGARADEGCTVLGEVHVLGAAVVARR